MLDLQRVLTPNNLSVDYGGQDNSGLNSAHSRDMSRGRGSGERRPSDILPLKLSKSRALTPRNALLFRRPNQNIGSVEVDVLNGSAVNPLNVYLQGMN